MLTYFSVFFSVSSIERMETEAVAEGAMQVAAEDMAVQEMVVLGLVVQDKTPAEILLFRIVTQVKEAGMEAPQLVRTEVMPHQISSERKPKEPEEVEARHT